MEGSCCYFQRWRARQVQGCFSVFSSFSKQKEYYVKYLHGLETTTTNINIFNSVGGLTSPAAILTSELHHSYAPSITLVSLSFLVNRFIHVYSLLILSLHITKRTAAILELLTSESFGPWKSPDYKQRLRYWADGSTSILLLGGASIFPSGGR